LTFRIAYCMHRGASPRQQDALLIGTGVHQSGNLLPAEIVHHGDVLIALADGVAASPHAQLASRFVLNALPQVLQQRPEWQQDGFVTGRHVREVHARLCADIAQRPQLHGSSTTLVVAQVKDTRAAVLNSGDSRAYVRRADGDVRQVSRDHTELQQLRDSGEADDSTEYASLYGALSDCLVADSLESSFAIHLATPLLAAGDMLVLCTDGVHDVLGDRRWKQLIGENADPLLLVSVARAAVLEAGAFDNFSVIALLNQGQ